MKKSLLVLSLLVTACTTSRPPLPPPTIPVSTPPAETSDSTTFNSADYGVTVEYSDAWKKLTGTEQSSSYMDFSNTAKGEISLLNLELSKDDYKDSNFEVAHFSLSTVPVSTQEECVAYPSSDTRITFDKSKSTVINGVTYYTATGGEGAMSHDYSFKYFRTYHNHNCFSVQETLGVINMGVYDTGTVTAVDEDAIWEKLDTVLQTVKFQ